MQNKMKATKSAVKTLKENNKNNTKNMPVYLRNFYLLLLFTFITLAMYITWDAISIFAISFALSYLLNPLIVKLCKFKIPHTISVSIALFLAIIITLFLISFIIPIFEKQIVLIISKLTELSKNFDPKEFNFSKFNLEPYVVEIRENLFKVSNEIFAIINQVFVKILKSGVAIGGTLSIIIFSPILSFFLLKSWGNIYKGLLNLIPMRYKKDVSTLITSLDNTLSGYLNGQLIVCAILGTFYAISFTLLNIEDSIALGVLVGMLVFIPYLGAIFGGFFVSIVSFVQFGELYITLYVLMLFGFAQTVESYLLTPMLVGKRVGLHPIWIIFGLIVFSSIFGLTGMLFALPLTAISGVFTRFFFQYYQRSAFFKNK